MRLQLLILAFGVIFAWGSASNPTAAQQTINLSDIPSPPDPNAIELVPVATDMFEPVHVTHAGDGSGRLFIVGKNGVVWVVSPDGQRRNFLDIRDKVISMEDRFWEQGLLSVVFHPDYENNGYLYVMYNRPDDASVIERYQAADPQSDQLVDAATGEIILIVEQPHNAHNGGLLKFGSDGYLYIGLGDGGEEPFDISLTGQDTSSLLGKILRIDVDGGDPYAIPPENPFADGVDGAPEVMVYGVRNPWRFSFDRETDDLYVGDVGAGAREEVSFLPAGTIAGTNLGWMYYEGLIRSPRYNRGIENGLIPEIDPPANAVMPITDYSHDIGCAISGGYVYRGEMLPALQGIYFYGDFCQGLIWYAFRDESGEWQNDLFMDTELTISSFGEDETGELYVVDYTGTVYQIVPKNG